MGVGGACYQLLIVLVIMSSSSAEFNLEKEVLKKLKAVATKVTKLKDTKNQLDCPGLKSFALGPLGNERERCLDIFFPTAKNGGEGALSVRLPREVYESLEITPKLPPREDKSLKIAPRPDGEPEKVEFYMENVVIDLGAGKQNGKFDAEVKSTDKCETLVIYVPVLEEHLTHDRLWALASAWIKVCRN